LKNYEIVYIIHPDLEGSIEKITDRIKKTVEDHNGKILREDNWGKKKLAYLIKKNSVGIYQFLLVSIDSKMIKDIERVLRLSEEIIRYIIVAQEEEVKAVKEVREKVKSKSAKPTIETKVKKTIKPKSKIKETKEESEERLIELDKKLKEIIGVENSEEKK